MYGMSGGDNEGKEGRRGNPVPIVDRKWRLRSNVLVKTVVCDAIFGPRKNTIIRDSPHRLCEECRRNAPTVTDAKAA
ncbi:hypothetical protein ANN_08171 [Periplaneta americana]|uniref:Uncharacterized protein n=1 Tax=Periplaneta americana TaxID=6978 RepID=A0ABQ8T2X2_PERAM|nr:hypothetical protein ANN_08171 [Periplaneta americana]